MHDNSLNVGIYLSPAIPQSFRVYAANIQKYFPDLGVNIVPFSDSKSLPRSADVIWDIRSGGGNPPIEFMLNGPPLVITVHGFAPISLSGWEYFKTFHGVLMAKRWAREKQKAWVRMRDGVSSLIAVSEFSRKEATRFTGIDANRIAVCHHGVDHENFTPIDKGNRSRYFFHVSNNEPRKNLDRILRVFRRLRSEQDVELLLKLPEDQVRKFEGIPGVRIVAGMLSTQELAELFRRSLGFVFPSLYEGFGMPILEAMASGCPVITSLASACPEVAGEAALLVDPRDEDALYSAMRKLVKDDALQENLISAGFERAKTFDWSVSATCHKRAFMKAAMSFG